MNRSTRDVGAPYDLRMTSNPPDQASASAHSLGDALAKNEEAQEAVQGVADELGVVHEVLKAEVAKIAKDGDAATAVERTAVLEKKLNETADKMAEVNEALADQKASLEHLRKSR